MLKLVGLSAVHAHRVVCDEEERCVDAKGNQRMVERVEYDLYGRKTDGAGVSIYVSAQSREESRENVTLPDDQNETLD